MKYNIDIDADLLAKAQMLSGAKTKNGTIEAALKLLIAIKPQKAPLKLLAKA